MATVTAGRAAAARVGVADGALQVDLAAVCGCAAIGALGTLDGIGHAAAVAVRGLTLGIGACLATLSLVIGAYLDIRALSTRGVTGITSLSSLL